MDAVLDMEHGAENFAKKLNETLVKDLVNKKVFGEAFTLNGKEFANFDVYQADWTERYVKALEAGDRALMEELTKELREREEAMAESAEEYAKMLQDVAADTTFKDLVSSWVSSLMDMEATAEDWAKNVGRTMAQRIIEEVVAARMIQPLLDDMQDAFDDAIAKPDATWQTAVAAMSPFIDKMIEAYGELQPIAEQILNAFGIFREVEETIEEVVEEAKEGFSDLRGAFVSSLMDMEADANKFARDITKTMTEQMIDKLIEQKFGTQLEALNEEWYNALEAGDTAAMERIRQRVIELQKLCGEAVKPLLDALGQLDETIIDMHDDFLSALMDMKAGTQDFVNDIRKLLTQKLVEKFVLNAQFDSWLQSIQDKYDTIYNSGMNEQQMAEAFDRLAAEWKFKADEIQQMTQRIFDLTGWSDIVERMNSPLTDLRSNFLSALMDMEADAKDFTNEISELLTEAFIDKFVLGDEFEKRLAEWQEQYAAIMKGNYSEEERADLLLQLQNAISAAKEGYAKEAQVIQELMGTYSSPDQQATMNMADKVTYDQFETYLGIAVAQQMATLAGNEIRIQILATLQAMSGITSPNGDTVREIRSTLNTTNEYLLDIKRSNKDILNQFGEKLDNIINKLSDLV
jgi:CHAD domain-containing protein